MNRGSLRLAESVVLLASLGVLTGCTNTVNGVGQDMQNAGSSLSTWAMPGQSVPPAPPYRPDQPPIQEQTPPYNYRYQYPSDEPIRLDPSPNQDRVDRNQIDPNRMDQEGGDQRVGQSLPPLPYRQGLETDPPDRDRQSPSNVPIQLVPKDQPPDE